MTGLNAVLNQFFEKILYTPASEIVKIPGIDLPMSLSSEEISLENHYKFWQARKKLVSFPRDLPVCQTIQAIGKTILTLPANTCPYPIQSQWHEILGEEGWHATQVNAILEHQTKSKLFPSLHFAANALATHWLGHRKNTLKQDLSTSYYEEHLIHILNISEYLADHYFNGKLVCRHLRELIGLYKQLTAKERNVETLNKLAGQIQQKITALNAEESLFVPLGWHSDIATNNEMLILQVECQENRSYRLRLLMNTDELIPTDMLETHDPAVTWEHITKEQLASATLWRTLWEPFFTLKQRLTLCTYDEKWFIIALNRLLGKQCESLDNNRLSNWLRTCNLDKILPGDLKTPEELQTLTPSGPGQGFPLWIAPSGLKPVKNRRSGNGLDKTLHKMVALILTDPSAYKRWKIEQRLYIFIHLYHSLKEQRYPRFEMHDLIETIIKAERKLWISIEKDACAAKSPAVIEELKRIIATFLDVKTRFEKWLGQQDKLELSIPYSPYPRFIFPFKVTCLSQSTLPEKTDIPLRQPFAIAPVQMEQFDIVNEPLLKWLTASYDYAKTSIETYRSSEWLALFTESVYDKLPIPRKGLNRWKIPPQTDPKIIQELMKTLYGLSGLLLYHAYSHEQILPQHLLHIYKIYRIQWALMQQMIPLAASCPISWIHFETLLQSRGNDFFPQSIGEEFYALRDSFLEVSPKGGKKELVDNRYALFDSTWGTTELSVEKYKTQSFWDLILFEELNIAIPPFCSPSFMEMKKGLIEDLGHKVENYEGMESAVIPAHMQFFYLVLSAELAQMGTCLEPKIVNKGMSFKGPDDFLDLTLFGIRESSNLFQRYPNKNFGGSSYDFEMVHKIRILPRHKVGYEKLRNAKKHIDDMVTLQTTQYWSQGELLKKQRYRDQASYELSLIAEGPSNLSFDHLLSYFEPRHEQLLQEKNQAFFLSILYIGHRLDEEIKNHPPLLTRLISFLSQCLEKDLLLLTDEAHQNRFIFTCEALFFIQRLAEKHSAPFSHLINEVIKGLKQLKYNQNEKDQKKLSFVLLAFLPDEEWLKMDSGTIASLLFAYGSLQDEDKSNTHLRILAQLKLSRLGCHLAERFKNSAQERSLILHSLVGPSFPEYPLNAPSPSFFTLQDLFKTKAKKSQERKYYLELQKERIEYFGNRNEWIDDAIRKKIEAIDTALNSVNHEIQAAFQDCTRTGYAMILNGSSLAILVPQETYTIDFRRGVMWRNGNIYITGSLPPEDQKNPHFERFKNILKERMIYQPQLNRYIPATKTWEHLSFSVSPHQVFMQVQGQEYRMLREEELHSYKFPAALQGIFSYWKGSTTEEQLICYHNEGVPCPTFHMSRQLTIHPYGNAELVLAEDRHFQETDCFRRLGFNRFDLLIWLDTKNKIKKVDLPILYQNKFLSFDRKEEQWFLAGTDWAISSFKKGLPDFLGESYYLLLKDSKNNHAVLLLSESFDVQRIRSFMLTPHNHWQKIYDRLATHALIFPLVNRRLQAHTNEERLFLAYLYFHHCRYHESAEMINAYAYPLGRPYSHRERMLMLYFFANKEEKQDDDVNASAVRLLAMHRYFKHEQEYPSHKELFNAFDIKNMIHRSYGSYLKGGKAHDKTRLEVLLKPYEQEELLFQIKMGNDKYINAKDKPVMHYYQTAVLPKTLYHPSIKQKISVKVWNQFYEEVMCHARATRDYNQGYAQCGFWIFCQKQQPIPLEELKFSTAPVDAMPFFRRAYELIISQEQCEEYAALVDYFDRYYTHAASTISYYKSTPLGRFEQIEHKEMIAWTVLIELDKLSKEQRKQLPALPPPLKENHFVSSYEGPHITLAKNFFQSIFKILGETELSIYQKFADRVASKRNYPVVSFQRDYTVPDPELVTRFKKGISPTLQDWLHSSERKPQGNPTYQLNQTKLMELAGLSEERLTEMIINEANRLNPQLKPDIAGAASHMYRSPIVTIDECIGLALVDDPSQWKEKAPHADSVSLKHLVFAFLLVATENQHQKRVSQEQQDPSADNGEVLQQMRASRRGYTTDYSNFSLLCQEYYANQRLRVDQVSFVQMIVQSLQSIAAQLIMGAGKTKVLAPLIALLKSSGAKISIFCVPASLFGTVKEDFKEMLWQRFKRKVDVLTFRREDCTIPFLWHIADKLFRAETEGTILITRPKDLQAFHLMLKERNEIIRHSRNHLYLCIQTWAKNAQLDAGIVDKIWNKQPVLLDGKLGKMVVEWTQAMVALDKVLQHYKEEIELLQLLQRKLEINSHILYDEIATIKDPKNQLSYPTGFQIQAPREAITSCCKLYFDWLADFDSLLHLDKNEQNYHIDTLEQVIPLLIDKAWNHYHAHLEPWTSKELFKKYMASTDADAKALYNLFETWNNGFNGLRKQIVQEISFLRYAFTSGLRGAFQATAFENYGLSHVKKDFHLVIPYECNSTPKEGSLYKYYIETLIKTCQYYRCVWDNPALTKEVLRLVSFAQSSYAQALKLVFGGDINAIDREDADALKRYTEQIAAAIKCSDPDRKKAALSLISMYLSSSLFPQQLTIDAVQLSSNPQDFPGFSKECSAVGGTWTYSDTWPLCLKRVPKLDTKKEILDVLRRNENGTVTTIRSIQDVFSLVKPHTCAILDAGALFKGISNKSVAKQLLEKFPERKGILYFERNAEGVSEITLLTAEKSVLIGVSDHETIKRVLKEHGITHPITYYDQLHVIGADIPQMDKTSGLVLLSGHVTLDLLLQTVMRLRGLLLGKQTVEYAIPHLMNKGKNWSFSDIATYTTDYQYLREKEVNYHGILAQINGAIRLEIDKKLRKGEAITDEASEFVLERQNIDLFKEFGGLKKFLKVFEALRKYVAQLPINRLLKDNVEAVQKQLYAIIEHHENNKTPLPTIVMEGDKMLDQTQEVDHDRNIDILQEQESERMQALKVVEPEVPWQTMDLKFLNSSPFGVVRTQDIPAFYRLNDVLQNRKFDPLFDPRILVSQNLITTYKGNTNSFLSQDQKPIHEILVIDHKSEITMILLTTSDAEVVKYMLAKNHVSHAYLMEPGGAIIQGNKRPTHPDFPLLLLQTLLIQGNALHLSRSKDLALLKQWIQKIGKDKVRNLFEIALTFRKDDWQHYLENPNLQQLFL